ncbi:aldo/keto reductase [Thermodesulfobacteriota bacterium]
MIYRKFGKLDWETSILGFGAMRLPLLDDNRANVDEQQSIDMIRYSVDHGVNYVDTAYFYHDGMSEKIVGRALADGYRQKVKLATKLPSWLIQKPQDFNRYLAEQLERLQTDEIDFYLLHGLTRHFWSKLQKMDVFQWAEKKLAEGVIHHLGFSFHDQFEVFQEIVDAYDKWTFCQIQYNYMDTEFQAGTKGLQYAADRGLAVVVMEPLRGGQLTRKPPEKVAELWGEALQERSQAEWALNWVWDQPGVTMALSGMSEMQHVVENVAIAERYNERGLNTEDLALIGEISEAYRDLNPIPCTSCRYCMPCPNGVDIPKCLELYNDAYKYSDPQTPRFVYRWQAKELQGGNCSQCLECEEKCPQDIPIAEWLEKVHAYLGEKD